MSVHKGIKYSCHMCQYQVQWDDALGRHKMSVQEGIKYSCELCYYQAPWENKLGRHMSIHEEVD